MDVGSQLLEAFLVRHAEVLLLIDHEQTQVPEGQFIRQQGMGADNDVHLPVRQRLARYRRVLGAYHS